VNGQSVPINTLLLFDLPCIHLPATFSHHQLFSSARIWWMMQELIFVSPPHWACFALVGGFGQSRCGVDYLSFSCRLVSFASLRFLHTTWDWWSNLINGANMSEYFWLIYFISYERFLFRMGAMFICLLGRYTVIYLYLINLIYTSFYFIWLCRERSNQQLQCFYAHESVELCVLKFNLKLRSWLAENQLLVFPIQILLAWIILHMQKYVKYAYHDSIEEILFRSWYADS
jgi:hypothetical protein